MLESLIPTEELDVLRSGLEHFLEVRRPLRQLMTLLPTHSSTRRTPLRDQMLASQVAKLEEAILELANPHESQHSGATPTLTEQDIIDNIKKDALIRFPVPDEEINIQIPAHFMHLAHQRYKEGRREFTGLYIEHPFSPFINAVKEHLDGLHEAKHQPPLEEGHVKSLAKSYLWRGKTARQCALTIRVSMLLNKVALARKEQDFKDKYWHQRCTYFADFMELLSSSSIDVRESLPRWCSGHLQGS